MSKFKVGDIAFSFKRGFGIINKNPEYHPCFNLEHNGDLYTQEGKWHITENYPSLLTLEEAAKLGYCPEKKKVKLYASINHKILQRPHGRGTILYTHTIDTSLGSIRVPELDIEVEI